MFFFNNWLQQIIVAVLIATIIEMIIPEGNNKKYIKMVLGVYIIFNIITPIINKISNDGTKISLSNINLEKYIKNIDEQKIEISEEKIVENNEENIKKIYIENLETDIKNKLENRGYKVEKIEAQIENNDEYKLKQININIRENDIKVEKIENTEKNHENTININIKPVEKVNIKIQENNNLNYIETKEKNNNLTKVQEEEIKKYISSEYDIKEQKIFIN